MESGHPTNELPKRFLLQYNSIFVYYSTVKMRSIQNKIILHVKNG